MNKKNQNERQINEDKKLYEQHETNLMNLKSTSDLKGFNEPNFNNQAMNQTSHELTDAGRKHNTTIKSFFHNKNSYLDLPGFEFNMTKHVYIVLLLFLIEYLLIFGFQLASYLALVDKFHEIHWGLGLGLLLGFLTFAVILYFLVLKRFWVLAFCFKFLEFGTYLVLMGWAVARLDFAFLSFSYMMILNILIVAVFVF